MKKRVGVLISAGVVLMAIAHAGEYYWIPPGVSELKGAFLQQNGRSAERSVVWKEYATQMRFAIMCGGDFSPDLAGVLKRFADSSGHAEFVNLPVCTFGGSRGGWWSMSTADKNPARVVATVGGHCGIWPNNAGVPTLFPITELDPTFYNAGKPITGDITGSFFPNRSKGALWTLAIVWGGKEHGTRDWEGLSMVYFDRMIRYRLPADASTKISLPSLKPYPESAGYLSDVEGSKQAFPGVSPFADYQGDKSHASWIPDEYLAWVWRAFVSTSPAVRITSPAQVEYEGKVDLLAPLLQMSQITMTAEPSGSVQVKSVEFYDGNIFLARADSAPFTRTICLTSGPHSLIAIATDLSGNKTSSKPVIVLVKTGVKQCSASGIGRSENRFSVFPGQGVSGTMGFTGQTRTKSSHLHTVNGRQISGSTKRLGVNRLHSSGNP